MAKAPARLTLMNSERLLPTSKLVEPVEDLQLPPWSRRRRIITTIVMMCFILAASALIGMGSYQIGVNIGWIRKPFSKETITEALLNDAGFVRAARKSALNKTCKNPILGYGYTYQSPFAEVVNEGDSLCSQLVAVHSTGADVLVTIQPLNEAREVVVERATQSFSYIETAMMDGTKYPTSRLSGIQNGVTTDVYVVGISRTQAYKITYTPTDPTLTGIVLGIVESFYSIPQ